jgi:hypothetical protein
MVTYTFVDVRWCIVEDTINGKSTATQTEYEVDHEHGEEELDKSKLPANCTDKTMKISFSARIF